MKTDLEAAAAESNRVMTTSNVSNSSSLGGCGTSHPASFVLTCAMLMLLGLLIILVNLAVILLVCVCKRLKTLTNLCLASLAASDLFAGVFALPLIVACSVVCQVPELCLAMDLCQRFLAMSTIIHLFVITTKRYIMIVRPMLYPRLVTKLRVLLVLLSTWVLSLTLSLIQLPWSDVSTEGQTTAQTQQNYLIYDFICFSIFVLLPLIFMVYAHVHILLVAQRHMQLIRRQGRRFNVGMRRRKGTLVYLAMIGVFVVGWFPYFLLAIEADSDHVTLALPAWAFTMLLFVKFGTALLNPLLYTYFKKDFRREVKAFFFKRRPSRNHAVLTNSTKRPNAMKQNHPHERTVILIESTV